MRSPSTATTRAASPNALGEEPGEQPDPGVEVEGRSPGCGSSSSSTVSTSTCGAPGCTCQNPSSATWNVADVSVITCVTTPPPPGVGPSDPAVVDLDDLARAVLAQADRPPGSATYCCRVRQRRPSSSPGTGSTTTSTSTARPAATAARGRRRPSARAAAAARRAGSRSPRTGTGRRSGTAPRPGRRRPSSTSTASAAPELVALGALGDLEHDRSPGSAWRTKTTRLSGSGSRATKWPPWATAPTSTSNRSPTLRVPAGLPGARATASSCGSVFRSERLTDLTAAQVAGPHPRCSSRSSRSRAICEDRSW